MDTHALCRREKAAHQGCRVKHGRQRRTAEGRSHRWGQRERGGGAGRVERRGWVSSTAEEAQGHLVISRRGRKMGEIDRSDGEKKGSQIPTWARRRRQQSTDWRPSCLPVASNHAKSILMTVYRAMPPHPFWIDGFEIFHCPLGMRRESVDVVEM